MQPTISFREDKGIGLVYCSSSNSFSKVTEGQLCILRQLAKAQEDVWLTSTALEMWENAGWITPSRKPRPYAEKPARTGEQPFRPLHALIAATTECNASCEFCSARPYLLAYPHKEFSSAEQTQLLAERLHTLGVLQCHIGGGEPTLTPYLGNLLKSLVDCAVFPLVVSNGTVWTVDQYLTHAHEGVNWAFSYHSEIPSEHDALLKLRGAHKKVSTVLEGLARYGLRPQANVVVGNHNRTRLESIIGSLSDLGVRDIILSQFLQFKRGHSRSLNVSHLGEQDQLLARWGRKGLNVGRGYRFRFLYEDKPTLVHELFSDFKGGCTGGLFESLVFPDGSVYPCDYLWEQEFCVGNLFDEGGIQTITTSSVFRMLHNISPGKQCLDCRYLDLCKGGCPGVHYLLEGRLAYPNPECPLLEDSD